MIRVTDKKYWLNPTLKSNLDSIAYNIKNDWGVIGIITGKSKTRIGKTVLATQIAYYLAHKLNRKFTNENILFSGKDLMKKSETMSPAVFVLDESRADLATSKRLNHETQLLIDFFNETGMLNNIIILVLPDYFDLLKTLAVGHSEFLINCFTGKNIVKNDIGDEVQEKVRGYYGFYNDDRKRLLYFKGKKNYNDYNCVKWNFWGTFRDFWVVDREEYTKKKVEFINRDREETTAKAPKYLLQRNALIEYLCNEKRLKHREVAEILISKGFSCDRSAITAILAKEKREKKYISTHKEEFMNDLV